MKEYNHIVTSDKFLAENARKEVIKQNGQMIRPIIIDTCGVIDYKNLLILFIKKKGSIIREVTGIDFITSGDIHEIYGWEDNLCQELIMFISLIDDHFLNPWCHINMNEIDGYNCDKCTFGKRHGICGCENSTYKMVIDSIRKAKIFDTTIQQYKLKAAKYIVNLRDIHKLYSYKSEILVSYDKIKLL